MCSTLPLHMQVSHYAQMADSHSCYGAYQQQSQRAGVVFHGALFLIKGSPTYTPGFTPRTARYGVNSAATPRTWRFPAIVPSFVRPIYSPRGALRVARARDSAERRLEPPTAPCW